MKSLLHILVLDIFLAGFMPSLCPAGDLNRVPLVINEFMASNNNSAQDPQGQYDDWIELYNYGSDAIDISGMYLTDNLSVPNKWRINSDFRSATIIPAGGYLLIWADDDTADAGLHANFKLSAVGEEIGLFDTDGSTLIDGVVFLDQTTDISYGRYPDANDVWRSISEPTPGVENSGGYLGLVADPEFSHGHGFYTAPFSVTIATESKDDVIYYTLDGREPYNTSGVGRHPGGIVYTNPVPITKTTHLRVKAIRPGWKPSNIEARSYIFLEPDVRDFSSNLPIAIIDTFGKNVGQTTETQTLTFAGFIDATTRGRVRITSPPDFIGRAGLNIRGKSSAGFAKKQYHLETLDEYNVDKDVSILGFPAESDWVLQSPYSDKSLMRNFLAYKWSNDIGRYAVRTRFIELFLNTDGGGVSMSDYVGVYVLMEKIKQGKNRVDITKLEPSDNTEPQITGGYIVKKDKLDPGDLTFSTSSGQSLIYLEPDRTQITQDQMDWIKNYINEFESVLYGPNFTDPVNGYAGYIDVDSFIDNHILVELTKNIDGFRLSTYMFKDRGGKLNMGPVWDYNLSLGNANYLEGWKPDGWYYSLLGNTEYPWWRRLFEDPYFRLRYADRWYGLRKNLFDTGLLLQGIDDIVELLSEAQVRNFDRWSILGSYVWPNWFIAQTYQEEIDWMKGWLEERLTWMDTQIGTEFAAAAPIFSQQGGEFSAGDTLSMTGLGRSPIIYYTLDGSDPRLTTVSLPSSISTTLVAENTSKRVFVPVRTVSDNWKGGEPFNDSAWPACVGSPGGLGFSRGAGYTHLISLDLTDRMLRQNATCYIRVPFTFNNNPDDFDSLILKVRYDDGFIAYLNGIEVARRNFTGTPTWNSGADAEHPDSEAINFEDIDLSAFLGNLRRGDNLLAIHGLNYSTISSDFLISVELVANQSIPPDDSDISSNVLRYTGPITLTHSTQVKARILRGGMWSALNEATFAVGPIADNLRITEIMYHPQNPDESNEPNEEYIELKNIGTETINLNLVSFTNGIDFTFPSLELAPNEYAVVVQDRSAFEAWYGTAMNIAGEYSGKLNNAGERIRLEDAIGRMILDFDYKDGWRSITNGEGYSLTVIDPTKTDLYSWNEKDSWRASAYAGGSPGEDDSDIIPDPGAVVINEVLAHSHADAADWIELHNTTEVAIDIGGWFLSDSNSNLTKYQIAAGTRIAPDGYILFYEDLHFDNPSDPGCYQPFALSENGEELYLSSAEGSLLTGYRQVEDFGASETDVSLGRYYKPSTGNYNFVRMSENTPDSANAYPKVGPIVINEIMYNPSWPVGGLYTNDQYEYIELLNISAEPVT
ncbi:MAG TPA: CotH kinase family protein, partial [Sedimentisphaerales bacterium]|nr:CotH kinase family protein [Sedimentisphaerales bacterium]